MKLHIYRGFGRRKEKVPWDVTHVIVDESVTKIQGGAFKGKAHLVSVIMGDNVSRIEDQAFYCCGALSFLRLSNVLEFIGEAAFSTCNSLEAVFLPSTVRRIETEAFMYCASMKLLILPDDIDPDNVCDLIIDCNGLEHIAAASDVEYEFESDSIFLSDESIRRVKEWLIHHMDESPFQKLCYDTSVTASKINDYLDENVPGSALHVERIHGMTPLHMLTMNPHAPADAIAALFVSNMEAIFQSDHQERDPLDNARTYNADGLVATIAALCNHRQTFL
uniref:Leucine-rich repeat domain-containing protein n=1 Tax=Chaetoceros debilis TaxID=122233 RepID=A0A7S3QJ06_9STRA|mmetsp:Transcript_7841/g.11658  ORF Transcript_7841/g.11658 Transcript_7841/m.11658 type:complete len:278 (+) Transcript_7841:102-935(+)